ncbi:peptidase U61 [Capsulimonas corticalis]|uniref:Peptidase U61 n=1 Tax=Capsulimonas corticalis TaxID=2219043 RepID=A0A402CSP5_9BACT|nr:LD-carboxypeptidase [Capsulimonas corticalis]BDI31012.1 peptidase U61 [Capsulimonas corticalis]
MRKPKPLPPGGVIGIVSPASPSDAEGLRSGMAVLEAYGFRPKLMPHALDRHGHAAGLDEDRAADFMAAYADPEIDLVWCARGGSASLRLWPHLDWSALAALPPKLVVGYSDITSLQIPLTQRAHIPAIHGQMVFELALRTPEPLLQWLLGLLQSSEPAGLVPAIASDTLVPGVTEGALCGGCLSLVRATLGTPYQIDATDKLLLMEDIGEKPWGIERDLVHLREAGVLETAAGFIVGEATDTDDTQTLPMRRIWADILEPYGKPTVLGFPFGHVAQNYALPLGCRARLDAGARSLTILESAVHNG